MVSSCKIWPNLSSQWHDRLMRQGDEWLTTEQAVRFSQAVLSWYRQHGRTDLPWQQDRDPYRVWLSEIMLQQTRVKTVIPYFNRFVQYFPTVACLANAELDAVLGHWSGLGYYARARHLHRAARIIVHEHAGRFPETREEIMALPGVGRSTAGAILAFCFGQREPILDGNVRRVLTRFLALAGHPADAKVNRILWTVAERLTPARQVASYTQAIMDLGATVCTRSRPDCPSCPVHTDCKAYAKGNPVGYPTPKRKKPRPEREIQLWVIEDSTGSVLLERRPDRGIWGGLWSLPETPAGSSCLPGRLQDLVLEPVESHALPPLQHGLSHFDLWIYLRRFRMHTFPHPTMDESCYLWYNPREPQNIGLPAVIQRLLVSIQPDL